MTFPRRRPPRIAIESLLIVFSILLALAMNAWWGGREDRARIAQALVHLDAEILANRDLVTSLLPYHEALVGIFAEFVEREDAATNRDLQDAGFRGFRPPSFLRAAWETALASGVSGLMDFDDVSRLGRVYSVQDRVDRLAMDGLSGMLGPGAFHPDNFASLMMQSLGFSNDLVFAQRDLLELYEAWIEYRGLEP